MFAATVVEAKALNWTDEDEQLYKLLFPLVLTSAVEGAKSALAGLIEVGIGIDWGLVNQAVVAWARSYTFDLVKGINNTTQAFLQKAIPAWMESGAPLDELVQTLAPIFGPVRAEMIAVTEVTRAYAEGNLAVWKESGVVTAKRWMTANDELVCPICEPLNGMVVELDESGFGDLAAPPAHVRCRCWLQPVLEK